MLAPLPRQVALFRPPPPTAVLPSLSIIIVNYRQWDWTGQLLEQLLHTTSAREGHNEIVLVDNCSPYHRLISTLRRTPGLSVRRWRRNRGFARAVNEGIRRSLGDWVLLLNPDVTVPDDFLDRVRDLTQRLDRDVPRTGVVGLGVRDADQGRQPSTGPFPTFLGTFLRLLLPRRWRKYDLSASRGGRVDWVSGCCLLVRRAVLEELGGLDADFFLYYEDVDLCRRAAAKGWDVTHEPVPSVIHHRPLHQRSVSPFMRLVTRHALLTYAAKHWRGWQTRLLARVVRCEAWLRKKWAKWRGDADATRWFRRLGHIATSMQSSDQDTARRILDRSVQDWEER